MPADRPLEIGQRLTVFGVDELEQEATGTFRVLGVTAPVCIKPHAELNVLQVFWAEFKEKGERPR